MNKEIVFEKIKEKELRFTNARKDMVNLFLDNESKHFSFDEIVENLNKHGNINIATTYNNLDTLKELEIIEELSSNGKKYFQLKRTFHGHFICTNCGEIFDIDFPGLACFGIEIERKYGSKVTENTIDFKGICKKCLEEDND